MRELPPLADGWHSRCIHAGVLTTGQNNEFGHQKNVRTSVLVCSAPRLMLIAWIWP